MSEGCVYRFDKGTGEEEASLYDERVKELWIWRKRYSENKARRQAAKRQTQDCGDFAFQFYIFDFARGIDGRYVFSQHDKSRLKDWSAAAREAGRPNRPKKIVGLANQISPLAAAPEFRLNPYRTGVRRSAVGRTRGRRCSGSRGRNDG